MKILVSGASGLVGGQLTARLAERGYELFRLTRKSDGGLANTLTWDPEAGTLSSDDLEGLDGVIHLAGEPIAAGRWNRERKARIRDSRVDGTRLLCERLAACENPPATLIAASAIGFYGDRGDEELTEESPSGTGFLADVCRDWEAATEPARNAGIRVVNVRIGLVLSTKGGALSMMLRPFKMGMGGTLGGGKPWVSWIHIDDLTGAIEFVLTKDEFSGPVNGVAPNPATNHDFTKALGSVLGRPTVVPAPTRMLRLALGEMADELLLCSTRVLPARLEEAGFEFQHPTIDGALRDLLA